MRRAFGWGSVGFAATAAALAALSWFARADSLTPDLSGIQAQIAAALSQALAAQTQATSAATSASNAQTAATTAALSAQAAQTAASGVQNDFTGSMTVAQVQALAPSNATGKRIFVTDLGGGPGAVYSTGTCFKRMVPAVAPSVMPATQNVSVTALVNSTLIQMTAPSSLLASVNVAATGLCPGDVVTIYMPNGVLTAAGTLGVSLNATSALSVTGVGSAYSADFLWTGTSALKLRGGPVQ